MNTRRSVSHATMMMACLGAIGMAGNPSATFTINAPPPMNFEGSETGPGIRATLNPKSRTRRQCHAKRRGNRSRTARLARRKHARAARHN